MNATLWFVVIFAGIGVGVWLVSFAVERFRPVPKPPAKLRWAANIPIDTVEVGGNRLRYVKTGKGPALVLLHTLRTQLDLFEKVVPELAKHFTVYALDYPGHGYSDIPKARYDATFFVASVEGFLDRLDLRDVTLAGVSIGGPIALIVAARRNPRVARVIAINPYDYAKGRGMARSSLFGWVVNYASLLPVIGETSHAAQELPYHEVRAQTAASPMRRAFRRRLWARCIWLAIVASTTALFSACSAIRKLGDATKNYGRIEIPVLLIWGDQDWAKPAEREYDRSLIPNAK